MNGPEEPRSDPELEELRRQLDAAYATTRPRRGFEDELWARLRRRQPWWRRLVPPAAAWPALGAVAAALVVGFLVVLLVPRGGGGTSEFSSGGSARPERAAPAPKAEDARPGSGSPGAAPAEQTDGRFGLLPRPPVAPSGPRAGAQPYEGPVQATVAARPPEVKGSLAVHRYDASAGVAAGAVYPIDGPLPPAQATAGYPARPPDQAARDAATAAALPAASSPPPAATLDRVQLVYVAVPDGAGGYLEPAYLFSGTVRRDGGTYEKRVLVPALAESALRQQ